MNEMETIDEFCPLVSIIIPVYNGSNYLKRAIDCALSQTYQNVEIIVVNDGSNDNGATEQIALSYGDRIRYFHKENGGVSTALNLGIAHMRGVYFSWLSHDDEYTPYKIENQIALLKNFDREKLLSICETKKIDKDGNDFAKAKSRNYFKENQPNEAKDVLMYLFKYGTFNGCSLLIPKKAFEESGTFDERLRYAQDSFMWLKIFLNGYRLVYRKDYDSLMRVHNGQLTQRGIAIYHKDSTTMSETLIPRLLNESTKKCNLLYAYAKSNAKLKNTAVWKKCIREGKKSKKLNIFQCICIRIVAIYGNIRPLIRKVYLKIKGVKTK